MPPHLTKSYEAGLQAVASIRSSVLGVVVNAMEARDFPTDEALARHNLSKAMLEEPYNPVSLKNYVAFFEEAARLSRQPSLGMRLGETIRPEDLGPVGVLFTMMQSLRIAIVRFCRFFLHCKTQPHWDFALIEGIPGWNTRSRIRQYGLAVMTPSLRLR